MAAVIPGVLYASAIMLVAVVISRRRGYPAAQAVNLAGIWREFKLAFWALAMPVFLIVGIRTGIFNVTESSAVAVVYALMVGLFIHRELNWRKIWLALVSSARGTAVIMIILGGAQVVSWFLAYEQAPQRIAEWMLGSIGSPILFLLLVNVLLLLVGTFMENGPSLVLLCPVLYPVAAKFGIDPYHFSMIVGINLLIGLITPPVAISLSIGALIAGARSDEVNREVLPFLAAAIGVVLLITFVPAVSLWLPSVIGGR
jgi:tripartite ATP-independent transporter DctM subunit